MTGRSRDRVHPSDGIVRSGRRMLAILVGMVQTRLNLLAVELLQEKGRIWLLLVLTALALMFASMTLLALSVLLVVVFWEDNRILAVGSVLAFYLLATVVTLVVLLWKSRAGPGLFAGTLGELSKDTAALADNFEADDVDFDFERRSGGD